MYFLKLTVKTLHILIKKIYRKFLITNSKLINDTSITIFKGPKRSHFITKAQYSEDVRSIWKFGCRKTSEKLRKGGKDSAKVVERDIRRW